MTSSSLAPVERQPRGRTANTLRILIVRLSSLGDIVHAMPTLHDIRTAHPAARVDWAVDPAFEPLVRCCRGVERSVPFALRGWRASGLWAARAEMGAFFTELREVAYDFVIDLQGLMKSALVARCARLADGGRRVGLANRTDGSAYEPLARLAYGQAIEMPPRVHVVERSRRLAAHALGHSVQGPPVVPWQVPPPHADDAQWADPRAVLLVHATAKPVKQLDIDFWAQLGRALAALGLRVLLPWGTTSEEQRARSIAAAIGDDGRVRVLPRLPLDRLCAVIERSAGCIGVDTGLTHIAATLGRPVVQLFIEPKAWRAAIDWMPLTSVLQATNGEPLTAQRTLEAWRRVSGSGR